MKRFYKVAIDDSNEIILINKVKHIGELKLLNYILGSMNKQTFVWYYNKDTKEQGCRRAEISESTMGTYLKNLKDYGILESPTRGIYSISKKIINYIPDYKEN